MKILQIFMLQIRNIEEGISQWTDTVLRNRCYTEKHRRVTYYFQNVRLLCHRQLTVPRNDVTIDVLNNIYNLSIRIIVED